MTKWVEAVAELPTAAQMHKQVTNIWDIQEDAAPELANISMLIKDSAQKGMGAASIMIHDDDYASVEHTAAVAKLIEECLVQKGYEVIRSYTMTEHVGCHELQIVWAEYYRDEDN